ncbi:MAG: BamA/TamA family outer membrane protein [Cyclobacteriaceae bacterium]
MRVKLVVISTIFILSSCLGTRYLEEGEAILKSQKIKSKHYSREDLELLAPQSPNTRLFGLPITHLVYLYKIGENHFDSAKVAGKIARIEEKYDEAIEETSKEKKKSRLQSKKVRKTDKKRKKLSQGNLFMRWGEKLAVFDSGKLELTKSNIKSFMFTEGYFDARVVTLKPNKLAFWRYNSKRKRNIKLWIDEQAPYTMDSVTYLIKDPKVKTIFDKNIEGHLLKGNQYNQDLITAERERVFDLMANNGYFDFKRQYVLFEVDSTALEDNRLIIRESIGNPARSKSHKVFKLDSVIFTTNPNNSLQSNKPPTRYNNVTYQLNNNRYYQRVIDWRIFMYPDSLYRKDLTLETQKQLAYLDMFKFVNINYDTADGKFIANIFTSPMNKYQTSIEAGLSKLDQAQLPGPFINFNAKNRNTFKGLEILSFDANTSIQGFSKQDKTTEGENNNYSRLQYGGTFSLIFPQFLGPLKDKQKAKIGQYNPKTTISAGANLEDRLNEYRRLTLNSSMKYSWQASDNSQLTFQPLEIAFIKTKIYSDEFQALLDEYDSLGNVSYVRAFRNSFVSSSMLSLDVNFNQYGISNQNSAFFRTSVEYGGVAKELFNQIKVVDKLTSYKYFKGNVDYRQNIRLNRKTAFAYRANVGIAYVFGNEQSRALPYEKYYFAGGSNSVRAWQPRRLGPGSYAPYKTGSDVSDPQIDYSREQPGDIIIELSAELRREFIGIIDYALFLDAGNVWLWRSKTIEDNEDLDGDDGVFHFHNFLKEFGVGGGAGLRLDFSFLILRLDAAYKIYNPGLSKGERYVLDDLNFKNLGPNGKMVLNLGIGYPF